MRGKPIGGILLPVLLAAGLGACANNGVRPGIVNTSYGGNGPAYGSSTAYGSGTPTTAQVYAQPGETGRVVSINDVSLRGGGGGSGNGPVIGGLLGGLGGIAIGASAGRGVGGGIIGGVLGAVGGAIAGTIFDRSGGGGGRGIEVTVQKDNGQTVTLAQRDDGDIQLGDRVQIVQSRDGVAKAVRDNSRQQDYQTYVPAPQDYRQPQYNPPPQDYRQSGGYASSGGYPPSGYGQPQDYRASGNYPGSGSGGGYSPPPEDYRQARYAPPVSSTHTYYPNSSGGYQGNSSQYYSQGNPQPQNDPRYGNIE